MAFSFNPSVEYVKIDEPALYELYQSRSPIIPGDPAFHGRPCEAYICAAKEGKRLKLYVSFLDTISKQIYVYTPDDDPVGGSGYAQLLVQAQEFVAAKGFNVDKVNIDFSSAIRQVIIRSLRIMRPPAESSKKILHLVPPGDKSTSQPCDKPVDTDRNQKASTDVIPTPCSTDVEKILAEKEAALQQVRAELSQLTQAREKDRTERSDEMKQAMAVHAELQRRLNEAVAAQRSAEDLLAQAERQKRDEQSGDDLVTSERDQLLDDINSLRCQLDGTIAAKEAMAEAFRQELAEVRESLVTAIAEKGGVERLLARERVAVEAAQEALEGEVAVLKERFAGEKAADSALIETLRSELDNAAVSAKRELAELRNELAAAQSSLVQQEQVQGELRDARLELAQLSKDNSLILVELEQLAEERKAESAAHVEEAALLRAEIVRLTRVLAVQEQVASREQTALRSELRKLVTELAGSSAMPGGVSVLPADNCIPVAPAPEASQQQGEAAKARPAAIGDQPVVSAGDEHEEDDVPSSGAEEALAILGDEFCSDASFNGAGGDATEFRRELALDAIPYRSSADVLAVYQSINSIQAVPIGNEVQKCNGFVCAVAENGVPHIYVAWHMPESGRVVVLGPELQPRDRDTCARVLRDAIQYFEIMGVMMEPYDLGTTPQKRRSMTKKIPVFRRVEKKEAEHEQPEELKRSA